MEIIMVESSNLSDSIFPYFLLFFPQGLQIILSTKLIQDMYRADSGWALDCSNSSGLQAQQRVVRYPIDKIWTIKVLPQSRCEVLLLDVKYPSLCKKIFCFKSFDAPLLSWCIILFLLYYTERDKFRPKNSDELKSPLNLCC
jgi:hypothetical protein